MNIADKIKQFDNMIPANVQQLENLFNIRLNKEYKQDDLVEILAPEIGNLRTIMVNGKIVLVDLNPMIDGIAQENSFLSNRNKFLYVAKDFNGNVLGEAYSINKLADLMNVSYQTIINIMKRKDKPKRGSKMIVEKIAIDKK